MTAPDPRLEEIEGRLGKATPGPWEVVFEDGEDWISIAAAPIESGVCPEVATIEIGGERDAEFIAAAPADVAYLLAELRKSRLRTQRVAVMGTRYLAELRKAQDKLARVEKIAASMDRMAAYNLSILPNDNMGISLRHQAENIRAAVADATGGGE